MSFSQQRFFYFAFVIYISNSEHYFYMFIREIQPSDYFLKLSHFLFDILSSRNPYWVNINCFYDYFISIS